MKVLAARVLTAIATSVAIVLSAAPAVAQRFDVTFEVDSPVRGGVPADTPGLAFTGAPLLFLVAASALLLAMGAAFVATSQRERPARA